MSSGGEGSVGVDKFLKTKMCKTSPLARRCVRSRRQMSTSLKRQDRMCVIACVCVCASRRRESFFSLSNLDFFGPEARFYYVNPLWNVFDFLFRLPLVRRRPYHSACNDFGKGILFLAMWCGCCCADRTSPPPIFRWPNKHRIMAQKHMELFLIITHRAQTKLLLPDRTFERNRYLGGKIF